MRETGQNIFTGSMTQDPSPRIVGEGNWIDSMGLLNYGIGDDGVLKGVPGNIPRATFATTDVLVGWAEDRQKNSVVLFIYRSPVDHVIYRFYYQTNQTRLILRGDLGLRADVRITDAVVVDGRYVIWTDGQNDDDTILLGRPRLVDMDRAILTDKILTYNFWVFRNTQGLDANDYQVQFRVTDFGGVEVSPWTTYAVPDLLDATEEIVDKLLASGLTAFCDIVNRSEYAEITMKETDRRLEVRFLDGANVETTRYIPSLAPTNHYHYPYVQEQFDLALRMPYRSMEPRLARAPYSEGGEHYGNTYQWSYRYVYYDSRRSAWSPISYSATNMETDQDVGSYHIKPNRAYNRLDLLINDPEILMNKEWHGHIEKVEIAYRDDNNGLFYSIGSFYPWQLNDIGPGQWPSHTNAYRKKILGNEVRFAVPSDDITSGDTQALKLYDWVPSRCVGLSAVQDDRGSMRLIMASEIVHNENPKVSGTIHVDYDGIAVFQEFNNDAEINSTFQLQYNRKYFKKGGEYMLGIQYYDSKGRTPGAVEIGRIRIPRQHDAGAAYPYFRIEIDSVPPVWAETWRVVRSRNLNQRIYTQGLNTLLQYITIEDDQNYNFAPAADATHVKMTMAFNAASVGDIDDTLIKLFDSVNQDGLIWQAEAGDYLAVATGVSWSENANGYAGAHTYDSGASAGTLDAYVWPIVGYIREVDNGQYLYSFVCEIDPLFADIYSLNSADWGVIIEAYRRNTAESEIIYETACYGKVIDGAHEQDHYEHTSLVNPAIVPAPNSLFVLDGDTFYTSYKYQSGAVTYWNFHLESYRPYPWQKTAELSDQGRPALLNPDSKQQYHYQRVRISDAYTPGTEINGLSAFKGGNFIDVNRDYGPIMTLKVLRDNAYAVCWSKVQPIYIGKGRMLDISGQESVGRSTDLMTLAQPFIQDWGTQHPESIVVSDSYIYGVDRRMSTIWRAATNGLAHIMYGNEEYFRQVLKALDSQDTQDLRILGGLEQWTNVYYLTISEHTLDLGDVQTVVPGRTWAFRETDNGWKGQMPFIPDNYVVIGDRMATYSRGRLWVHNDPVASPNRFYNTNYVPWVKFVMNLSPKTVKVFQNIGYLGKGKWYAPEITIPANEHYPNGMLSRLKANKFRSEEGKYVADFLRDINDTHPDFQGLAEPTKSLRALLFGRPLRGEIIVVTLEAVNGQVENELFVVDTEFFLSMKTS